MRQLLATGDKVRFRDDGIFMRDSITRHGGTDHEPQSLHADRPVHRNDMPHPEGQKVPGTPAAIGMQGLDTGDFDAKSGIMSRPQAEERAVMSSSTLSSMD